MIIDLNQAILNMEMAKQGEQPEIPQYPNMVCFLNAGEQAMDLANKAAQFISSSDFLPDQVMVFNKEEVHIQSPILKPGKIICVGQNYREHILEMNLELPKYPVIFSRFNNCIIGADDSISLPEVTKELDYEAEFLFVIGKKAKNVSREQALEYIAGFTIGNDVSARDLQNRTSQWTQGKILDGTFPVGPYLVTKDEVNNIHNLDISLYVNGERRQHSNTCNLVFDVEYLVEYLSQLMTLEPGDIILTGTPGGVGAPTQSFLQDGDVVEVHIEQLGVLKNKVQKVKKTLFESN
jgi:acylpyruvate hydrolase